MRDGISPGKISYEIDPHNRLIAKRSGEESFLNKYREILEGRFSIGQGNSLTYHLKKASGFDLPQQIKLFGNWKINKRLGVYFKAEGQDERSRVILLAASYKIDKGCNLEVGLRNSLNQDLGLEARLSKRFFDDQGEVFIRALASRREKAVSAGAGFRW